MKNVLSLLLLLFVLSTTKVLGHALWIETDTKGETGKAQQVKIYYAEYAEKKLEAVTDWYSDVRDFELWLVGPDNEKVLLESLPKEDHFLATFTPEKEGIYTLAIAHTAKDFGGDYVYQFNSSAKVAVGKSTQGKALAPAGNEIYVALDNLQARKSKDKVKGRVFINGEPAADITLGVGSPVGWSKSFTTDKNGFFEFEALWDGTYMLEASYTEDKAGELHGKPYAHVWRCATHLVTID